MLTSKQNPKLKLVRALLGRPKERAEANAYLAEGVRLVEEAFQAGVAIRFVLYTSSLSERGLQLVDTLKNQGVEIDEVPPYWLDALSDTGNTQGILAVVELAPLPLPHQPTFLLILDQIRDPGNLGTLLRTAAAAGVQAVLIPPETTDPYAPKVVRAGMGAHFRLPIHTATWEQIREQTAGLQILLADMTGSSCWQTDLRPPLALIVGGEADGASPAARALATHRVCVPMPGEIESLNAGVAGAILLFEIVRQRQANPILPITPPGNRP